MITMRPEKETHPRDIYKNNPFFLLNMNKDKMVDTSLFV